MSSCGCTLAENPWAFHRAFLRPGLWIDTPLLHYSWPQSRARGQNNNRKKSLVHSWSDHQPLHYPLLLCLCVHQGRSIFSTGINFICTSTCSGRQSIYTNTPSPPPHTHTHFKAKWEKPSSTTDVWEFSIRTPSASLWARRTEIQPAYPLRLGACSISNMIWPTAPRWGHRWSLPHWSCMSWQQSFPVNVKS